MNKIGMNKELVFLRTYAVATAIGMIFLIAWTFHKNGNQKFSEIDVERINIVEKDGTVKMIITNVERFPSSGDFVNGNEAHGSRQKTSGMLFFNEEGLECGGFIYSGQKTENGHEAGMSFTHDQFDGDQVMQMLTRDIKREGRRAVSSLLVFNDREEGESQAKMYKALKELELLKNDPDVYQKKIIEYSQEGMFKSTPRIMLGKTMEQNNGLFLFDNNGIPRAKFFVDSANNAKLDFFDEEGNIIASFPEKKMN